MKQFYEVNGITLCVEDSQEFDKKPMLFIHGLSSNKEGMIPTAAMFKEIRRTICVDTRGHGESTHPEEYTLEDHAKDIHGLIEAMGLKKVDIMGASMGSYIALAAAEYRSDDIDHLILAATKPSGDSSSVEKILKEKGLDVRQVTPDQIGKIMMSVSVAPSTLEKIKSGEMVLDLRQDGVLLTPAEKGRESKSLAGFDNSRDLDKVNCKTLVIAGEYDGINPPELGKQVAEGIEGAEFVLIKNAGHMLSLENPKDYKKAIEDFLSR